MNYNRRWQMLHHKYLGMPTTATKLSWSYVLGPVKKMRGNLPTDVHQLLIVNEAGGASIVQTMTMRSGLSNHRVAAFLGGGTCVSNHLQRSDAQPTIKTGVGVARQAGVALARILKSILRQATDT